MPLHVSVSAGVAGCGNSKQANVGRVPFASSLFLTQEYHLYLAPHRVRGESTLWSTKKG